MGEADGAQILSAQQAERPEHVLMLQGAAGIDLHQRHDQQVDDPARIHVGRVERRLDLRLDLEPAGDPGQDRVGLPAPVRHGLQQGGEVAERRAAPEIREPEHVEQHEPAARIPDLAPELADEVGLTDAGLAHEHARG